MNFPRLLLAVALARAQQTCVLALLPFMAASLHAQAADSLPFSSLEETVCGAFSERWAFQNWSTAAGSPDDSLLATTPGVLRQEFVTEDKRTLVGFKIPAFAKQAGSVLFIQGNGMLVDRAVRWLQPLSDAGLDVYLYDFRGYGRSNGNRRLQAMASDYRALVAHLTLHAEQPLHAYAVSFGGVLLLNAIDALLAPGRAVVDSTPSLVSPLGCPASFDPVRHIPTGGERLLFIEGEKDDVVSSASMRALRDAIAKAGGRTMVLDGLGHPFTGTPDDHFRRLAHVSQFLTTAPTSSK